MNKKIFFLLILIILFTGILSLNPSQVRADNQTDNQTTEPAPLEMLQKTRPGGPGQPVTEQTIASYVGGIIQIALGFVGIILFIVILYGGFLWMTAGGNEEQVTKAKTWIKNGVIGIIIIVMAYAISYFVIKQLLEIGKTRT